jgi:hypothetical protein
MLNTGHSCEPPRLRDGVVFSLGMTIYDTDGDSVPTCHCHWELKQMSWPVPGWVIRPKEESRSIDVRCFFSSKRALVESRICWAVEMIELMDGCKPLERWVETARRALTMI